VGTPSLEDYLREGEKKREEFPKEGVIKGREEIETPSDTGPCVILSVTYSGEKRKALVKLYDPSNGKIYFWYDNSGHKPYCLTDISPEEIISNHSEVVSHKGFDHFERVVKYDALSDKKVVMTKVVALDPLSIGGSRGSIRELLPRAWEAKIKYHHCYIYDTGLIPCMYYRIEKGKLVPVNFKLPRKLIELVDRLYGLSDVRDEALEWVKLLQAPIPEMRMLAMDIEVHSPVANRIPNPKEAPYPVIAIAFSSNDGFKEVLLLDRGEAKGGKPKDLDGKVSLKYYKKESDLLREAFKIINSYPILLTFNGDNFDLNYLYHRALKLGFDKRDIPIVLTSDAASLRIGIHIDLYKFFENHAMQVYAFKNKYREVKTLDSISSALLGVGKVKLDKPISELNYLELAKYCFRDADLTLKLARYNNNTTINLIIMLSRISKLPIEDLTRTGISNWVKNLLYFEHRRKGYLIPNPEDLLARKGVVSTKAIIKGKKYLGAIVINPLPGIFFDVTVLDFASLYPSVIKKWNLSYETVRCPHEECKSNRIPGTTHWVCKKNRGLMSTIVGFLRDFRVRIYKPLAKKEKREDLRLFYEVVQQALKVFINASYGVFGSSNFPLYCPPVAESTTALGRYAIIKTIKKAYELGLMVIYGDTDSVFLWRPTEDKISELLAWSERELGIDLDVDKVYRLVAFSGRKKNYLGILKDGGIDVKGLVGKKRNTPEFIKELFNEISSIIMKAEDINSLERALEEIGKVTRRSYLKLKSRAYSLDELAFRVALTKPLKEYVKNTPQHVKAARQLEKYGIQIEAGDIISFVKVRSSLGVKPVQLARIDEIDEEKYLAHIETTCRQVLEALGIDFDKILGASSMDSFL